MIEIHFLKVVDVKWIWVQLCGECPIYTSNYLYFELEFSLMCLSGTGISLDIQNSIMAGSIVGEVSDQLSLFISAP